MFQLPSATGEDVRTAVIREMTLYRIQREIFCPVTGSVMDIRTAVAVAGGPDGDDVLAVMSPEGWELKREVLLPILAGKEAASVWIGGAEQPK